MLDDARTTLADKLDPATVSSAAAMAANFLKTDPIANGCGISVGLMVLKQ